MKELTDDRGKYELEQHRWGNISEIQWIPSCGNVSEMGILRFYQKGKKGIGGLMGISLAMVIRRLPT